MTAIEEFITIPEQKKLFQTKIKCDHCGNIEDYKSEVGYPGGYIGLEVRRFNYTYEDDYYYFDVCSFDCYIALVQTQYNINKEDVNNEIDDKSIAFWATYFNKIEELK